MGVKFTGAGERLHRTTGAFLSSASNWSLGYWFQYVSATVPTAFRVPQFLGDASFIEFFNTAGNDDLLLEASDGTLFIDSTTAPVAVGTWIYSFLTYDATTHELAWYLNGVLIDTITCNLSLDDFDGEEDLGADTGSDTNIGLAYYRSWQAKLTTAELSKEMFATAAVRTANLFVDSPLTDNTHLQDNSGNGRNWTAVGSPITLTSPSNVVTAIAMSSLPYDNTQARTAETEFWWRYTTGPAETLLSYVVTTNGTQLFSIAEGDPSNVLFADNLSVLMQTVLPSTDYYFRAYNFSGGVTSVRLRVAPRPAAALVDGALVIPSVFGNPQRATVYDPTDGTVLKVISDFPEGVAGDSIGDVACVQDGFDAVLYDTTFSVVATLAAYFTATPAAIRANPSTRRFWTGDPTSSILATVGYIDDAGNIGGTTWAVTTTDELWSMAISRDETILYWGIVSTTDNTIKRYDLVNSVALADLNVSPGSGWHLARPMFVLSDGTICAGYIRTSPSNGGQVIRYDTDGTILNTYDVATAGPDYILDSLSRVLPEGTDLWVWLETPGGSIENPAVPMHFQQMDMTDLSIVDEWDTYDFENGISPEHWQEPAQFFGPDTTSIFWPFSTDTPPPVAPPTLTGIQATFSTAGIQSTSDAMTCIRPALQRITLIGTGFQEGLSVIGYDQFGNDLLITIDAVTPTTIQLHFETEMYGLFCFVVTNPDSQQSQPLCTTSLSCREVTRMRRLRRATVISNENKWIFYKSFTLDYEAGVGLTSGQGSDPVILLRWSDDGGHIFSDFHQIPIGKLGAYKHRAMWRRLGRSRQRIFEVVCSDPIKIVLIDGFLEIEQGTS